MTVDVKEPFRCSLAPGQGDIDLVPGLTVYAYHPAEAAERFAVKYWHTGIDDVQHVEVVVQGVDDRRRQYTVTGRMRLVCSATPSVAAERKPAQEGWEG